MGEIVMKNEKFTALLLVSMLLLSFVVTGCGKDVTAQECSQVLWDINVKRDISSASKLNLKEEDAKASVDKDMIQAKEALKESFTDAQINFTDAQLEDVCNGLLEAYGKITVKIEEVSNDGKKAQIKYTTTYFDLSALDEKAANDALSSVQSSVLTDETQLTNKFSELYIQNLISELKNATISTDTKDKTYTFVKQGKVWIPEDTT